MAVFFLGAVLFLLGFIAHVALWRIRRPHATAQGLIILFVAIILCGASLLALAGQLNPGRLFWLPGTLDEWMQSLTMALALAAAYVVSYPAIEVASPTLVMIDVVAKAGPQGIAQSAFYAQLDDEALVVPRIADLLSEGLATQINGRYVLTAKGRRLAALFMAWRRVLDAGLGG